jgi:hypothetical protein
MYREIELGAWQDGDANARLFGRSDAFHIEQQGPNMALVMDVS